MTRTDTGAALSEVRVVMTLAERIERVLRAEDALSSLGRAELSHIASEVARLEADRSARAAGIHKTGICPECRRPSCEGTHMARPQLYVPGPECEEQPR